MKALKKLAMILSLYLMSNYVHANCMELTDINYPSALGQAHVAKGCYSRGNKASDYTMVVISASWCGPCAVFAKAVDKNFSSFNGKLTIRYIYTDDWAKDSAKVLNKIQSLATTNLNFAVSKAGLSYKTIGQTIAADVQDAIKSNKLDNSVSQNKTMMGILNDKYFGFAYPTYYILSSSGDIVYAGIGSPGSAADEKAILKAISSALR